MAGNQIISRESFEALIPELKKAFASKTEVSALKTGVDDAIKGVKIEDNTLKFYADKAMTASPAYTLDLPAEMVLDQAATKFEPRFAWSSSTYPGSTDPRLDGKPVMVLAVKGEGINPNYSFLNMERLVDTYTGAAGDGSAVVTVEGYQISVNVKISEEADNQLQQKSDGSLYVPKPGAVDVSNKATKVHGATTDNLASLTSDGDLADSGIAKSDVLTTADIDDFTESEIAQLLSAE